jgi:uncharacterized protein (DUF1810 family)
MEIVDSYNLERFVAAQNHGDCYETALNEVRDGKKTGHWIWWVFPQLAGLGSSPTSRSYSISSLDEAIAYLRHPVLGPRLRKVTMAMNGHTGLSVTSILGFDDVKFRSSMTLFMRAAPQEELFHAAIERFFAGKPDERTDELLEAKRLGST